MQYKFENFSTRKKTGITKALYIAIFSTQTLYSDDRAQQDLLPDLKSIKNN